MIVPNEEPMPRYSANAPGPGGTRGRATDSCSRGASRASADARDGLAPPAAPGCRVHGRQAAVWRAVAGWAPACCAAGAAPAGARVCAQRPLSHTPRDTAAQRLKSTPANRELRMIFFSGGVQSPEVLYALTSGPRLSIAIRAKDTCARSARASPLRAAQTGRALVCKRDQTHV